MLILMDPCYLPKIAVLHRNTMVQLFIHRLEVCGGSFPCLEREELPMADYPD